jgi:hypothetical protein
LLGVSILLAAAMASNAASETPLTAAATARSLHDFGSCFIQLQARNGHAWAFMPSAHGGTFTNAGAEGAAPPYWLQVRQAGDLNNLRLYAAGSPVEMGSVVEAIGQCR